MNNIKPILYGVSRTIVSDQDSNFTSQFCKGLYAARGMKLNLYTAYHPLTNGHSKQTIQTLEELLYLCVLEFEDPWQKVLPIVVFSYNNSYHHNIRVAPFEALYGRKSMTHLF